MLIEPTEAEAGPDLIPARMLNEVVYCPRLFYLEYVQGEWDDNADTVQGKRVHRRVDARTTELPDSADLPAFKLHARSVTVSSVVEGLIAKTDLIEAEDGVVLPVDYKRGAAPDVSWVAHGAWPPDRVQIGAQVLALRENGYRCDRGVVYYAASKTRVVVEMSDELASEVRAAVAQARRLGEALVAPPPLVASPKCPRCSLVGICLPDETNALLRLGGSPDGPPGGEPSAEPGPEGEDDAPAGGAGVTPLRSLVPPQQDRLPLYVQTHGARIGRSGDCLEVRQPDGVSTTVRLRDTSHVCVFGAVQISAAALNDLCERGIGVSLFSFGGWHYGQVSGFSGKNVLLRIAQFEVASRAERRLPLARTLVAGKILNCRTLLRRNSEDSPRQALLQLKQLAVQAQQAEAEESLLGIEGTAARIYFEEFATLLAPRSPAGGAFDFRGRNRRPPRDPVNALLSLSYALLVKDVRIALCAAGFDPMVGFYHKPRHGRPALALDLMEEFRPLIADSVVLSAINTETVQAAHFLKAAGAVALTDGGRKAFLAAYERRMKQEVLHPLFKYPVSYRQVLEIQARLLGRAVTGEIAAYPSFRTR